MIVHHPEAKNVRRYSHFKDLMKARQHSLEFNLYAAKITCETHPHTDEDCLTCPFNKAGCTLNTLSDLIGDPLIGIPVDINKENSHV